MKRICGIVQRFLRALPMWLRLRKEFGAKIAFWMCWAYVLPSRKGPRYMAALEDYFCRELAEQTAAYQSSVFDPDARQPGVIPVWFCWLTGESSMPELVRLCHTRLQRMLPEGRAKLTLLTLDNYRQYISLPDWVERKYADGIISPAHFSDVLRFSLLSRYGGMWLDATVYASAPIPEDYLSAPYYTQKVRDKSLWPKEPSHAQWCGFIWSGCAGNPLFSYLRDGLCAYWKKHDTVVDYIFFDYIILAAYHGVPAIRQMIDAQEPNNEEIWALWKLLPQPFDRVAYEALCRKNIFHKLTYKGALIRQTEDGRETYYQHLLAEEELA